VSFSTPQLAVLSVNVTTQVEPHYHREDRNCPTYEPHQAQTDEISSSTEFLQLYPTAEADAWIEIVHIHNFNCLVA
jgi:hypothetical protein